MLIRRYNTTYMFMSKGSSELHLSKLSQSPSLLTEVRTRYLLKEKTLSHLTYAFLFDTAVSRSWRKVDITTEMLRVNCRVCVLHCYLEAYEMIVMG